MRAGAVAVRRSSVLIALAVAMVVPTALVAGNAQAQQRPALRGAIAAVTVNGQRIVTHGWALNTSRRRAVWVNIWVDGRWLRGTKASLLWRGLDARFHRGNRHGAVFAVTATPGTHRVCWKSYHRLLGCRRVTVAGAPQSTPQSGRLVWDDEFAGTQVDRAKWHVRNDTYASNELSIDTSRAANVSVSDGVLTIRARREQYRVGSTQRSYTSGYLDTIGLHSQKYGRWTMRAKLPTAQGLWPAFWLRGDHSSGEIDILEAVGGLSRMTVQTVFPSTNDGSVKRSKATDLPADDGIGQWHVYGFTWTPGTMSWDIDGKTVFSVDSASVPWVSTAFEDSMNIRLNLQVGGSMPNYFAKPVGAQSALPDAYQIDWIRVYSR